MAGTGRERTSRPDPVENSGGLGVDDGLVGRQTQVAVA